MDAGPSRVPSRALPDASGLFDPKVPDPRLFTTGSTPAALRLVVRRTSHHPTKHATPAFSPSQQRRAPLADTSSTAATARWNWPEPAPALLSKCKPPREPRRGLGFEALAVCEHTPPASRLNCEQSNLTKRRSRPAVRTLRADPPRHELCGGCHNARITRGHNLLRPSERLVHNAASVKSHRLGRSGSPLLAPGPRFQGTVVLGYRTTCVVRPRSGAPTGSSRTHTFHRSGRCRSPAKRNSSPWRASSRFEGSVLPRRTSCLPTVAGHLARKRFPSSRVGKDDCLSVVFRQ